MEENEPCYRRSAAATYLTEQEHCPISAGALANLATLGGGPEFFKSGRYALYPQSGLRTYAATRRSKRVRSTSELRVLQDEAKRDQREVA
jgi:hypothetical protein